MRQAFIDPLVIELTRAKHYIQEDAPEEIARRGREALRVGDPLGWPRDLRPDLDSPLVVRRRLARQLPRARTPHAVEDGGHAAGVQDRGFRGTARTREHWHAPVGDRR